MAIIGTPTRRGPGRRARGALGAVALLAVGLLAVGLTLAGCGGQAAASDGSDPDAVRVVASTDVYGSLAQQVGGDDVQVTSLIDSAAQDPHSYEATPHDKLELSKAALVVSNGGGYDEFFDQLLDSTGKDAQRIVATDLDETYQQEAKDSDEANEHVWYRLSTARAVTQRLAADLSGLDPVHRADYEANANQLTGTLDGLQDDVDALAGKARGRSYFMTEPVPQALLEDAGLTDGTPAGLSEAVEEGEDIPPATFNAALQELKEKRVAVFAYNEQTAGGQTQALRDAAEAAGVPVVDFTETLPEGQDYQEWMAANIEALQGALAH